ncbi:putative alpha-tubulin polyglutamylase Ttll1 [Symbiodinium microadriaticum]|uniref:Tubulin--tyrosine ligase-like protein 5 n=1 Tax=Symbiodinium microadriaticum TaxID=2951 RepID=A0A1Q9EQX7_SYMMI|nr:putative alpha-tubulin polyglutamylase Ttll1 [Symbiodinium microadriaticum]
MDVAVIFRLPGPAHRDIISPDASGATLEAGSESARRRGFMHMHDSWLEQSISARAEESSDPAVKLFVISSAWPYKPTHSPLQPFVLLHGATGPADFTGPESACHQHIGLARSVLRRDQNDLLFVIDVSDVAECHDWQAEVVRPARSRRMLERWFAKFNPREATVIAFGNDAELWVPLVRLHDEPRISKLIVLGDPPCQKSVAQLAAGHVEVCILGAGFSMEALVDAMGSQSSASRLDVEDLHFTFVNFVQTGHNVTLSTVESFRSLTRSVLPQEGPPGPLVAGKSLGLRPPVSVDPDPIPADVVALLNNKVERDILPSTFSTQFLAPGTAFSGLIVNIQTCSYDEDASVLRALLADAHGSVEGLFPTTLAKMILPGKSVAVSGRTLSLQGRLLVLGQEATPNQGLRDGYMPVSDGRRNVSDVSRKFGCLVLRGRKCVLARDCDKQLYIPVDEARNSETAQQAATRAVAESCDIYPEEFALLGDVPPAVYYEKAGQAKPQVVSIFAAVATSPPPPGSAEDTDTIEDVEDMYDWFPFEQALSLLSVNERHAIARLAHGALASIIVRSPHVLAFARRLDAVEVSDGTRTNARAAHFRLVWAEAEEFGGCTAGNSADAMRFLCEFVEKEEARLGLGLSPPRPPPSGAPQSSLTTLRMDPGLEQLSAGKVALEKQAMTKSEVDDVPRDLGNFLAKKELPPYDMGSYVPPEALFCWTESDFASYINSGGFVKPKLKCQYYLSPENPQTIVDLLEPILSELNWTCTVDSHSGREESLAQVTDYMGMPVPRLKKQDDGSLEVAPVFIWEASRNMIDHGPTLKLVNRLNGVNMFTKVGMLELIRERCIERDIPINFPPPWYPLTFTLPDDLEQWKRHAEANPHKKWIYKPSCEVRRWAEASSLSPARMLLELLPRTCCKLTVEVNKISDVDSKVFDPNEPPLKERNFANVGIIQEYMVNPMLLENRKFAIRVYMLVARTKPLLTFHYNFGYVKRLAPSRRHCAGVQGTEWQPAGCGEFYDENKFNREDLFRHITEQEFQKKQDDFGGSAASQLMSIEDLDKYLQENYGIPAFRLNFWQQVKAICMEAFLPQKVHEIQSVGQFEIFGLDIIVDADQRLYLLEANRDPSWVLDTQVKKAIIPDMIREMMEIVLWAHSDEGKNKEAMLHSPMRGFEVLIDEAFDFQAVDVE